MSLNWQSVPGAANYISTWGKHAWCCNSSQDIFQWLDGVWVQRPGKAVQVSVGRKGVCWCINAATQCWQWNPSTNNWDRIPGDLTNCSVCSATDVWGVNTGSNKIYHWNGSAWAEIEGSGVQISVGKDGTVWCINRAQEIFRRNGLYGQWERIDGKLTHLSVFDKDTIIGNNSSHEVFQWQGEWIKCPGKTTTISVGKKKYKSVWGVNSAHHIWHHKG